MGQGYLPASAEEWRGWGLRGLLLLVLVAVTWPIAGVTPAPGLDPSWTMGLSIGVADGLAWGRDIVFTYGPLGYSVFPVAIESGTLLGALFVAGVVQLLLVGVLYVSLRRRYGPVASTLLAFGGACAVGMAQYDATLVIGFGLAVLALTVSEDRARKAATALAIGGSALAAFGLLIKLNAGIGSAVIVAIALAAMPSPKRNLPLALGSGLLSLVVLWLLAGQPLGAIADYLRNGYETVSGYVEAMGYDEGGTPSEWQLLAILVSAVTLSALSWASFPELSDRRRGGLALVVLTIHYFVLREVFVRYSVGRGAIFSVLVAVALIIPWHAPRRALGLAIAAALSLAMVASLPNTLDEIWGPWKNAHAMAHQVHVALDGGEFDREQAYGRAQVKAVDDVPPRLIAALRGRCVSAEPIEIALLWAYRWDWCQLPALQTYDAYTSRLDRLDAGRYADPETGPDGVIRQLFAIDERLPAWESPAAMLALLCNFHTAAQNGTWQALVRVPDRCGAPRDLGTVSGELGKPIRLPPAPQGTVLVGHVHGLEIGGLERLEMLVGRPSIRRVAVDHGPANRVAPDTVQDGLILDVPPAADFPPPFNLGQDAHTVTATIDGTEGGPVSVDLTAVPISAAPSGERRNRAEPERP
jgi:hypothetical protein